MSFERDPEDKGDNRPEERLIIEAIFEDSLPTPVQAFDADGVVTRWNAASARLYGYSAEETVGRRLQDTILSAASGREFEECIKQVVACGKPIPNRQWEICCRNGVKRWVYSTIFPILKEGRVVEVFCMDLDMTDHIMAEEELRKAREELELRVSRSQSFLKNTFDCIKDAITIMDTDMNIIGANNTMETWYPSKLPLVGKKCHMAYYGRREPCENCPSIRAIETRSMQTLVRRSTAEDGADRWREIASFPFKDSRGEAVGAITMVRDITARKRIEEALELERSQLLSIFDSVDESIYVSDPHTYEILYANRAIKDKFGKELIGGTCYREFQEKDAPCEFCTNARILRDKDRPYVWEFFNPVVNKYFSLTDRIIKWPDGRDVRFEIAIDITDRKKAEEALWQAKSDAELYVDLMGHDINNMNQVGTGYLELAMDILTQRGKLDLGQYSLLAKSLESFKNSSRLIDNVRKIQRERDGDYEAIVADVNDVLLEAIRHYSSVPDRNVTINYAPAPGCTVKANELIKDIFLNLIGNAIKHSDGPVTIGVKLEKVLHGGREFYAVSVEDDGPGIPDSLKSTLFERLNLASTRARGKGFGLCLIKMLVDDYSGRFWAEDRVPGDYRKGAKFVVMLPAMPVE